MIQRTMLPFLSSAMAAYRITTSPRPRPRKPGGAGAALKNTAPASASAAGASATTRGFCPKLTAESGPSAILTRFPLPLAGRSAWFFQMTGLYITRPITILPLSFCTASRDKTVLDKNLSPHIKTFRQNSTFQNKEILLYLSNYIAYCRAIVYYVNKLIIFFDSFLLFCVCQLW